MAKKKAQPQEQPESDVLTPPKTKAPKDFLEHLAAQEAEREARIKNPDQFGM